MERAGSSGMSLSRRSFLGVGAAAAGASLLAGASGQAGGRRPNILLILTDQQNLDAISAYRQYLSHPVYGCHHVATPHLDRLAGRGMSFLQSYTPDPLCSPARSSMFTGRMPSETGVLRNNMGIDARVPNVGQWLEAHTDYHRVYCGKWHAGGMWNYPEAVGPRRIPGFEVIPAGAGLTGPESDYAVSSSVCGFLRSYEAGAPFLAVASLMNPHDIVYWTDGLLGTRLTPARDVYGLGDTRPPLPPNSQYDFSEPEDFRVAGFDEERWRNYAWDYYRLVEMVDAEIGRLLDAVDDRDDETVIIFTSDHGEGLGRHGRVGKNHPFECNMKVPLIISWPGVVREGALNDTHLVSGIDLSSTICELSGAPAMPLSRGRSLLPLLREEPDVGRDHLYIEVRAVGRVIRSRQYKYARYYQHSEDWSRPFVRKDGTAARFYPGKRHTYEQNPNRLLFDLEADPWELTNLAQDPAYAEIIAAHEKLVETWELELVPGFEFSRG